MSIRFRIALLTTALMAVLLISVGTGIYITMQRSLNQEINGRLWRVYQSVAKQTRVIRLGTSGPKFLVPPPEINPFASPGLYIQLTNAQGRVTDQSFTLRGEPLRIAPSTLQKNLQGQSVYVTSHREAMPIRILSAPLIDDTGTFYGTVQVAEPLHPMLQTLGKLRLLLFAGVGLGVLATAIGAYVLAGRSLRPLTRITNTARAIGLDSDLSQRIDPPPTHDEVRQLADTFNEMLVRLEEVFAAERRFVSDASHELRTPLTALRGNAEILLRQIEAGRIDPDDLREGLGDIRDEAERMGRLVQNLLILARADVGWKPELEPIHLDQVVTDAARLVTPLVGKHTFQVSIDGEIDVVGNADQLKQLLLILLDNAFTYTPDDGTVGLTVRRNADVAEIIVQDSGPGIPPEQQERIFDRFYRGDVARAHGALGAGLGLAIAQWIVECHQGQIQIASPNEGGTVVTVTLPLADAPDGPAPTPRNAQEAATPAPALAND